MSFNIKTVTVIGANGTMGCNISGIFASFGNAKVYMVSRDIEKSKKAVTKAAASVRAGSIEKNLIPADYSMLEECISKSDLVFESAKEDLNVKIEVTKSIAKYLKPCAVACSGTSGLSITKLAECLPLETRKNYFGVHMFNPPYNLNLCELIQTQYSDLDVLKNLKNYLSDVLLRTVVEVKDKPAFLGNRIGFQFINEALQYAEKYKDNGGIDYIDAILGAFTGRAMAPLTTSDFVGLDVHKAIVDNLYFNTNDYAHDTFVLPKYVQNLIDEGKLGRKTQKGLYQLIKYDNGLKRMTVYDIATKTYRDEIKYVFPFSQKMIHDLNKGSYVSAFKALIYNNSQEAKIAVEFLLKYVIYSIFVAEEVGYDIHSADDAMATGFNWCPPLSVIDALSTVTDFGELAKERLNINPIDLEHLLSFVQPSKYDYRLFFKAKK